MRLKTSYFGLVFVALELWIAAQSFAQAPNPVALKIAKDGNVKVQSVETKDSTFPDGAIIVFADKGGESLALVHGQWEYVKPSRFQRQIPSDSSSRGDGQRYHGGKANWSSLDLRLRNTTTTKGKSSLLVPCPKATLLDGELEFYRESDVGNGKLDELKLSISKGKDEILSVEIPAGQQYLRWNEIAVLPDELSGGLSPGVYWIQYSSTDGEKKYPFRVGEKHLGEKIFDRADSIFAVLGDAHPLSVQFLAEEMLLVDSPFLCEAFVTLKNGCLKNASNSNSTHLKRMQEHVLQRLRDPGGKHDYSYRTQIDSEEADNESLKKVADLIDRGHWSQVTDICEKIVDAPDSGARMLALATMYRAVAKGHSGPAGKAAAIDGFRLAIEHASTIDDADVRFRCHSNFGNFLLDASFDGLHRLSFDSATTRYPLLSALTDLPLAEEQFELAKTFARSEQQKQSTMFDFARHWFLLAEFGRIVRSRKSGEVVKRFISKCESQAERALATVLQKKSSIGSQLVPASHELMANILFRRKQYEKATEHIYAASNSYVDLGFLPGFESSVRLRALIHEAAGNIDDSLADLKVAAELSLILQSRFSDDSFGRSRAGFLSRRILANGRRIELLVAQNRHVEALECIEQQKAIALRSLIQQSTDTYSTKFSVAEAMKDWPENTCLLQYHLGPKISFAFLVDRQGEVHVQQIRKEDGTPVNTSELLGRVQKSWTNIANYKQRYLESAVSTSTPEFDNHWQDELHELFDLLVPKKFQEQILEAERLTIVPHHSLHFFPFAALVAKKDESASSERLARPDYLLDRIEAISYAPSLRYFAASKGVESTVSKLTLFADDRVESNLAAVNWEIDAAKTNMDAEVFLASSGGLTSSNALQQLNSEKMVFFGCHGENETEDPLLSRLVLADRDLLCKEIFESEMASPFVFLSACETALAESSPLASDDLFGLERALLSRGCQTVVSGMWLVDDRRGGRITSEFLQLFSNGQHDAARCLADSQRSCIFLYQNQDPLEPRFSVFTHPHFWAVFRVCGNPLTKWRGK